LANAVAVAATDNAACVLDKPGRVRCWGHGALGQLGHGQLQDSAAPVEVKLPGPALALTAGSNHVCARLQNGRAVCWGSNDRGQLGNGASVFEGRVQDAGDRSPLPVAVVGLSSLTHVVAGGSQTCGLATGTKSGVFCWGGSTDPEGEADVTSTPRFVQPGPVSALAVDSHGGWVLSGADWPMHWGMQADGWQSKPVRW
jgi:alpha-tubulin suppressor-like RCC1 family protein